MNNRKIYIGLGVLLVMAGFVFSKVEMRAADRSLLIQNVEALANGEDGGKTLDCYSILLNEDNSGVNPTHYTYCGDCRPHLATKVGNKGTCQM